MIHVTTTNSLRAGIDQEPHECEMCGHNTAYMDWVGVMCDTCGADLSFESTMPRIVKMTRIKLGSTRKQIAQLTGLKPSTIAFYENTWCSKKYFEKLKKIIKQYYSS